MRSKILSKIFITVCGISLVTLLFSLSLTKNNLPHEKVVYVECLPLSDLSIEEPKCSEESLGLTGFETKRSERALEISFSHALENAILVKTKHVPNDLQSSVFLDHYVEVNNHKAQNITIPIDLDEPSNVYSIFLFDFKDKCVPQKISFGSRLRELLKVCPETTFVEFIRQPKKYLNDEYNYKRALGYTILGRRAFEENSQETSYSTPIIFTGLPDLTFDNKSKTNFNIFTELDIAAKITREIWSEELSSSPTTIPYANFLSLTLNNKMEMIRSGEFGVMCQGIRDLFLHLTSATDIKARAVSALNYYPLFNDLTPFSHATAEVWIQDLNKWVIVDPWFGFALMTKEGNPVSAEDIILRIVDFNKIAIVPLIESRRTFSTRIDGTKTVSEMRPESVSLFNTETGGFGLVPGYLSYFNHVSYQNFDISDS